MRVAKNGRNEEGKANLCQTGFVESLWSSIPLRIFFVQYLVGAYHKQFAAMMKRRMGSRGDSCGTLNLELRKSH